MTICSTQREHRAMATRWRCWLAGEDREQLEALGNWWADEIDRWDRLLSKFDPGSEVTRLNRAPPLKKLKVQRDLLDLLRFCAHAREALGGLFDVTATSTQGASFIAVEPPCRIDLKQNTFHWTVANRQLDFGGVAKGYVLDRLARALREYGVTAALLDAGGSSMLTWDDAGDDLAWQVSLAPAAEDPSRRLLVVEPNSVESVAQQFIQLRNEALSYSATRPVSALTGQTIDPRSGTALVGERACVVLTESAAWAEVLSTTALCMGEDAAAKYIEMCSPVACRLGWIDGAITRWGGVAVPAKHQR